MNKSNPTNKWPLASLLTSLAASLCCIAPVLALVSGVSGAASSLYWLEAGRPYLLVLSIVLLGWSWYQQLRHRKAAVDCGCGEEKRTFWQGRPFLAIVTVIAGLLMAFPAYARIFYNRGEGKSTTQLVQDHRLEVALGGDTATVSIYKVGLICNAAPNIGCGSRSKPVLLTLEKNPAVKEAWLNRQGTM